MKHPLTLKHEREDLLKWEQANARIQKIDSSLFTWGRWRQGTLLDLGVYARAIRASRRVLRDAVVGYCDGSSVPCRPKPGTKAVMFTTPSGMFWTHLFDAEFEEVFG